MKYIGILLIAFTFACAGTPVQQFERSVIAYEASLDTGLAYYSTVGAPSSNVERKLVHGAVLGGRSMRNKGLELLTKCIVEAPPSGDDCPSGTLLTAIAKSLVSLTEVILLVTEER